MRTGTASGSVKWNSSDGISGDVDARRYVGAINSRGGSIGSDGRKITGGSMISGGTMGDEGGEVRNKFSCIGSYSMARNNSGIVKIAVTKS